VATILTENGHKQGTQEALKNKPKV